MLLVLMLSAAFRFGAPSGAAAPPPPQADMFTGSDACRDCHTAEHGAWSSTKHAHALSKLSQSDRSGGKCIGCHVTDTAEMLAASANEPKFPNVQCESCHGAGRKHVEAAKAGKPEEARTKAVSEETCTRCHNSESPSYRPFIYRAMVGLSHPAR